MCLESDYQGVSGSGKSTVGMQLSEHFGIPFLDADDIHSPEAIAKMSAGHPLTDEDRWPWLKRVRAAGIDAARKSAPYTASVVACSALKKSYRDALRSAGRDGAASEDARFIFVYLHLTPELLKARLTHRTNHFMKEDMLMSQLAALEPPSPSDEADVLSVDILPCMDKQAATAAVSSDLHSLLPTIA